MNDRGVGATLAIQSVAKIFPGSASRPPVEALRSVDLTIKPGEFVSLIGPSGCGKSTLLDLIAGLETPSSGSVSIDGMPIVGPGSDRSMVFQQYALFPWMTAVQNVAFAFRGRSHSKTVEERTTRAHEALARVGLGDFAASYPHQLSGGMRQRVAIARALVTSPKVLLMDEPFGALDALNRELLQEHLRTVLAQSGATVVFVTHSLEEAVYLSDRIVVLTRRPGKVRSDIEVPIQPERGIGHTEFLSKPEVSHLREQIWELLAAEMRETSG